MKNHRNTTARTGTGTSKRLILLLIVLGLLLLVGSASAQDIGQMATNATGSVNKVGIFLQVCARLVGLGFVISGVVMHYKAHKEKGQGQSSHGLAITAWVVGGVLFYVSSLVHTTGNTLWGSGGGDTSTIQISQ